MPVKSKQTFTDRDFPPLFDGFEPKTLSDRSVSSERLKISKIVSVVAVICLFGITMASLYDSKDGENIEVVFVEIKALSEKGYPIAGATVKFAGDTVGSTDAFGEWRRYLTINANEQHFVEVFKSGTHGRLAGGKKLDFQKDKKTGELAAILRIRLMKNTGIKRARASSSPSSSKKRLEGLYNYDGSVNVKLAEVESSKSSSDRFSIHYSNKLRSEVLPTIKNEFTKKGYRLSDRSLVTLELRHLPLPGRPGFIRANIFWREGNAWQQTSFLRNFRASDLDTAIDLITVAKANIPITYKVNRESNQWFVSYPDGMSKSLLLTPNEILTNGKFYYPINPNSLAGRAELLVRHDEPPCASGKSCNLVLSTLSNRPPRSGWHRLTLKVPSSLPQGIEMYISGFLAKRVARQTYEFWGEPQTQANLTIVEENRITHRSKFLIQSPGPSYLLLERDRIAQN